MGKSLTSVGVITAAISCGVVGGVFFAFSNFVMGALGRLQPTEGIAAMNAINITVINPLFMFALFGAGVLCVGLAIGSASEWGTWHGKLIERSLFHG